uniref:Uncharacterized protein n=1 Tax=Meloidogyne javanica TaxID=6303 RepID=A0A915LL00_MELJA
MAQPSPPTDDELHLKGLQEGTEDNDNFIEESDWTRRIAGAGDGNRKVPATGANRIIDEAKLNQLLPRLNSQGPTTPSTTISTTTTELIGIAKMENETAQLIAAIENVLADAEVGPNAGGYWLHEAATASTSTTPLATKTLEYINETTTKMSKNTFNNGENTTKSTFSTTKIIPVISEKFSKKKEGIKYIPEAEEEEQAADIASLQLDSVAAPVLPESSNISIIKTSSSMPETSKTAVPNLFNLPNNSTMPNFSTMIKPVNSIIDGIGPLILPLIGYSRQALDSYSLNNNLLPGVPSVRQQSASEPPSLELLDKIVEQRRQRENSANELMMKRLRENKVVEQNTVTMPQTTTIIASPPSDSGYDNGRRVVLDKFHEDSGEIFENFSILEIA